MAAKNEAPEKPARSTDPVVAAPPSSEPSADELAIQLAAARADNEALAMRQRELEARAAAAGLVVGKDERKSAPAVPLVASAAVDFDVTAMEAESTRRNLEYQQVVELVRDQVQTGRFANVPAALAERNFHFVRVGLKGDARAERKAEILRQKGYVDAPKGVRAIGRGFEQDGERAIILCASAMTHQNLLRDKAVRSRARIERLHGQRQREIEDKLRRSMPAGTDVHVAMKIGHGSGGMGQVDQEVRAAMRDLPRG